jgi:hypothetical protein
MSEQESLSDPDLLEIERRLSAVSLSPTQRQRERLLYLSGVAAGRAQMKRRAHAAFGVAALSVCVCAGLTFILILPAPRPHSGLQPRPSPDRIEPISSSIAFPEPARSAAKTNGDVWLSAVTDFDRFSSLHDVRVPKQATAGDPHPTLKPVLTAAGVSISTNL